jgi:LexA-binding, inner membrane-associated putative hydrolase
VRVQPGVTAVTPLDFVSYPYSHSLLMLCVWGVAFGGVYVALRGARAKAAIVLALLVVSHWVLDYVTHRPDMPITPTGSARVGLGLWNSVPGTLVVEFALLGVGVALYLRTTRARTRAGVVGFWSLVVFLVIVYLASAFGPPPPGATAVAWSAEAMWLLVAWGYWVDRSRSGDGHTRSAR